MASLRRKEPHDGFTDSISRTYSQAKIDTSIVSKQDVRDTAKPAQSTYTADKHDKRQAPRATAPTTTFPPCSALDFFKNYILATTIGDEQQEYQALLTLVNCFLGTFPTFSAEHFQEMLDIVYVQMPKPQSGPHCPRAQLRRLLRAVYAVRLPWDLSENKVEFEYLLQEHGGAFDVDFFIDVRYAVHCERRRDGEQMMELGGPAFFNRAGRFLRHVFENLHWDVSWEPQRLVSNDAR